MNNKLLYNLMVKRIIFFNVFFLFLFCLFEFKFSVTIMFYVLLLADILIIIQELNKKTHYPAYCYIYTPFKDLFNYENNKSSIKRNENIYYILLVPLFLACFFMTFIIKKLPSYTGVIGLRLPFILIIVLLDIEHIIKIKKYSINNLK